MSISQSRLSWNQGADFSSIFRPELLNGYVSKELSLTEQCIRVNPKSYNSWFHRSWLLDQDAKIDYEMEFLLCDKCLELDERNCKFSHKFPLYILQKRISCLICFIVHCWDYRRTIVAKSKTSMENELNFSTSKINKNFSNYSSWHYRSELLPRIYPSAAGETQLDEQKLAEGKKFKQRRIKYSIHSTLNIT